MIKQPQVLIGIDFGMKRIGLAIGQTITQTARPLATINARQGEPDWQNLEKIVKQWNPDALVIGIPLNMDGTDQPITHQARAFAAALHNKFALNIYEIDERLSTKAAREKIFQEGGYKALQSRQVDEVAAQLLLEDWFANHQYNK